MIKLVFGFLLCASSAFASGDHDHGDHQEIISRSSLAQALVMAVEEYSSTPQASPILALESKSAEDGNEALIYSPAGEQKIIATAYHCHADYCHEEDQLGPVAYNYGTLAFDLEAFEESLAQTLDIFERKVSPLTSITEIKLWQVFDQIEVRYNYADNAGLTQSSYYMCHVHGSHFDCHRKRNPGIHEPIIGE